MATLLQELVKWRVDRPDEWKMDELISMAQSQQAVIDKLKSDIEILEKYNGSVESLIEKIEVHDLIQQAKGISDLAQRHYTGHTNLWMLKQADKLILKAKELEE